MEPAVANSASDWSNIRETIIMIYLSTAQLESSMREGTEAVYQLADSMMVISKSSQQIEDTIAQIEQTSEIPDLNTARESAQEIAVQIKQSVVAHQFHDRITQRLEHVTHSLGQLCSLISSPEKYADPGEWRQLQSEIRDSYTMEAERLMFEHIMMGVSVEEALEIYHHNFKNAPPEDETEDDVELF
jgi:hypothetical protein